LGVGWGLRRNEKRRHKNILFGWGASHAGTACKCKLAKYRVWQKILSSIVDIIRLLLVKLFSMFSRIICYQMDFW